MAFGFRLGFGLGTNGTGSGGGGASLTSREWSTPSAYIASALTRQFAVTDAYVIEVTAAGDGGGGGAPSLTAPSTSVDAPLTDPPTYTVTLSGPAVSDIVRLQVSASSDFGVVTEELTNTLDSGEVAALEAAFTGSSLAAADYYVRARLERGVNYSSWSSSDTFTVSINLTAPSVAVDDPLTNPATYTVTLTAPAVDDLVTLEVASDSGFVTIIETLTNTLDAGEVSALEALFTGTSLGAGDYWVRAKLARDIVAESAWSASDSFTIAADDPILAPVLTIDSPLTNPPTFTAVLTAPLVDDVIRLQIASDSGFVTVVQNVTNTLDMGEVADEEAAFGLTSLGGGNYWARARLERGATPGDWSNSETFTITVPTREWASPSAYIASAGVRQFATPETYLVEVV